MSKYYDWKIDDNADSIIWIKQKDDGTLRVIADYSGYWKLPQEMINDIMFGAPNVLYNNQRDFTGTCGGQAAIAEWTALGGPTKVIERYSPDYIAAMPPVPPRVMRHIEDGGNCMTEEDWASLGIEEAN